MRPFDELPIDEHVRDFVQAQCAFHGGNYELTLSLASRLMNSAAYKTDMQFCTQVLGLICTVYFFSGNPRPEWLIGEIYRYLSEVSHASVFDAMTGHIFATTLLLEGDRHGAAECYWAAATSPSSSVPLAMQMGLGYLRAMIALDRKAEALGKFAIIVRDLLLNGVAYVDVGHNLAEALRKGQEGDFFPSSTEGEIVEAIFGELDDRRKYLSAHFAEAAKRYPRCKVLWPTHKRSDALLTTIEE
jgi:hypothetical protein